VRQEGKKRPADAGLVLLNRVGSLSARITQGHRRLHLLSAREREILDSLCRGGSTRRIAE